MLVTYTFAVAMVQLLQNLGRKGSVWLGSTASFQMFLLLTESRIMAMTFGFIMNTIGIPHLKTTADTEEQRHRGRKV